MKFQFYILLLFPLATFSQLSEKVNAIYKELNSKNRIESQNIGYSGTESDSYKMYEELASIATDDEVLYMSQNGNKVVKGYLSEILVERKSKNLTQLFSDYIKKDQEVHIQTGCTGYSSTITGELYSYLVYQKEKIDFIKNTEIGYEETKAYEKETKGENYIKKYQTKWTKQSIDSLLIQFNEIAINYDSILPETLNKIFRLNDCKFNNYKRVKYFAYKYPTREIMATLANFRKRRDLSLFHKNIDNAFLAISKFPDESFLSELKEKVDKKYFDYDFQEATTSFCTQNSIELLDSIVKKYEEKRDKGFSIFDGEIDNFYNQLEKRNCAVYDDYLIKIWINHKIISFTFFQKIKDTHYNEILQGFLSNLKFSSASINETVDYSIYSEEELNGHLCPQILKYLKENSFLNQNSLIDLENLKCNN